MSDLKYQNLKQLKQSKAECIDLINKLSSKLSGQKERLKWIDIYIEQNTVIELTIEQIEKRLGHKVIIKG